MKTNTIPWVSSYSPSQPAFLQNLFVQVPLCQDGFVHIKRLEKLCRIVCIPYDYSLWLLRVIQFFWTATPGVVPASKTGVSLHNDKSIACDKCGAQIKYNDKDVGHHRAGIFTIKCHCLHTIVVPTPIQQKSQCVN